MRTLTTVSPAAMGISGASRAASADSSSAARNMSLPYSVAAMRLVRPFTSVLVASWSRMVRAASSPRPSACLMNALTH